MVPDEQIGKLNTKDTLYLFLGFYKETKAYRLIYS